MALDFAGERGKGGAGLLCGEDGHVGDGIAGASRFGDARLIAHARLRASHDRRHFIEILCGLGGRDLRPQRGRRWRLRRVSTGDGCEQQREQRAR